MKKKVLYTSLGLVIIGLLILIHFITRHNKFGGNTQSAQTLIFSKTLLQADSLLQNNPPLALIKANEILALLTIQKNDTESIIKAKTIIGKVENINGNVQSALNIFNQALQMAIVSKSMQQICAINIEIGQIYYKWGQYDKSFQYFEKAQEIAQHNNLQKLQSNALNHIGKYYRIKGENEKSITYYQLTIKMAKKQNNKTQIATTLSNIGKYYASKGDIAKAFQNYLEAYHIVEKANDQLLFADICNLLAGIYLQTNHFEKSLEYNFKALQIREKLHNAEGIAKSYINMGKVYLELKNSDTAKYYFTEALKICEQISYKKGTIKASTNLGKLHLSDKKKALANMYLQKALKLSLECDYDMGIAESSLELGNLNKNMGNNSQAISYYLSSLSNCKETNIDELLRDNYNGLYECYLHKPDYINALKYHVLLLEEEKKILNVENNRQTAVLNITFDTERREEAEKTLRKNVELSNLKMKQNKTFMWLAISGLCFTIILCFLMYSRFENKRQANLKLKKLNIKITEQNKKLELLNAELKSANNEKDKLFSIIAHELRNPLYWFQNLAEMLSQKFQTMPVENMKKSLLALDESAKNAFHLMDNLLQWSRSRLNRITPKTSVYNLREVVTNSVQMFNTILDYREIEFKNTIAENVTILGDQELLSCVIRNLVSNAIKYTPCGGAINISCSEKNGLCTILVSDTGKGINTNIISKLFNENNYNSTAGLMQEQGSGLGLKLCKEFVELNGGKIWIKSKEDSGTQIYFTTISFDPALVKPIYQKTPIIPN